ncbi:Hemicentin-1 [Mactra antiquata]
MQWVMLSAAIICGILSNVQGDCPHARPGLKLWSDTATWTGTNNPANGGNVFVTEPIIVDVASVSVHTVTIQNGGMLTFSPEVDIDFRAANIYIYNKGAMEIGSEDCPYQGQITITLTGNRQDHQGETHPKAILVDAGGTLEVHGEPRLPWTKITETLNPLSDTTAGIMYDHAVSQYVTENDWVNGVVAYTFTLDGSNNPTVKQFGAYELKWHNPQLVEHINNVADGDILMMASQREIRRNEGDAQLTGAYDAIETLIYGEVTGDGILRSVQQDGSTWAFVYQKGNPDSYQEVTNPMGTTSVVRYVMSEAMIFSAWSIGGTKTWQQQDHFRISNRDGIQPKLRMVDDVTTWGPGDKIVIASTDYNPEQVEEREVVMCTDCANNEIRINDFVDYVHFGEVLYGAVDMRAEVALLSRRQVIKGEMEDECPDFNENCDENFVYGLDTFGAHIKILRNYANVHLENFELFNAGQQTDSGRYPIHFHMCFDKAPAAAVPYIRGVSIHDTFARCITIHGSHGVEIIDNACYKHMGHGYFLEDGGELNTVFDGNLAIQTLKAPGGLEPIDARIPAAFWITSPQTKVVNNVAAGGYGAGIWFVYPDEPFPPTRDFNVMEELEARRTKLNDFYNNVAHSNHIFGIMMGNRLKDDRTTTCCNKWQPLEDPKDPLSTPLEINLKKITSFKNRMHNIWIEGGYLNVQDVSEGQQFERAGRVSNVIVIGDSVNKGVPDEGIDRSLPFPWEPDRVHSGIVMWKGPTFFENMWLTGFQSNDVYDTAAIAKKRRSPYFSSVNTPFKNVQFGFDDGEGEGTIAISGTPGVDPGWEESIDGEQIAGFTWYQETENGEELLYIVKPDHFSAAADDCVIRPNWRMAICQTKYGNVRFLGSFSNTHIVVVRDDLPSAQLDFAMKATTGPQVVMDGSRTYTAHFTGEGSSWIRVIAEGIEIGDKLRVGVCIPPGADFEIQSFFPVRLTQKRFFVEVSSLAELDADDDNDGKKFYYDSASSMIYFKFIGVTNRAWNESATCGGNDCPEFRIVIKSGDLNDMDCRNRLYTAEQLSMSKPALPEYTKTIPADSLTPPEGYGAGLTRPFTNREVVDGGYSDWSKWSTCSKTCDEGIQYRTRACNNPLPANGGAECEGDSMESQPCTLEPCAIDGGFSQWVEWSSCTQYDTNYCAGIAERTRECSEPTAQFGGAYCEGSTREVKPCTTC